MQPLRIRAFSFVILAAAVAIGCDRDESISFYQAPKDSAPTTAPSAANAQVSAEPAPAAPLTWKVPTGWKESQSGQQMRFATFVVDEGPPPVEFTITPLGEEAAQ